MKSNSNNKVDEIYHACLNEWDKQKLGLDIEDSAGLLIDVVSLLEAKIKRDEEYACSLNSNLNSNGSAKMKMKKYYVATLSRYVLVDAEDYRQAKEIGLKKLEELYTYEFETVGIFPIEIREVRIATKDEIEMLEWHNQWLKESGQN